jgi:Flp pilus assembly protein protease CpaA
MTKEEILKMGREDNGGRDSEDLEVQNVAAKIAYFSSLGLCAVVSILSWIFTKRVSVQCWIIFFGMLSVAFFVKYLKKKKLHELFVALGYLVIFILLIVTFIFELTGRLGGKI